MADGNPRAVIGDNKPPVDPFDAFGAHIGDLMETARGFLDGEPIDNQALADRVSQLLDECRKAAKDADKARAEEKKPHDEAAKAVQAKWKPLIDRAELAAATCKSALLPWLAKLEAERRVAAEAARLEAERKAAEAAEALRTAQASDLDAREAAEAMVADAKAAGAQAAKAERSRAQAHGGARATSLRTYYTAVLSDGVAAARWAWQTHREECEAFFTDLAQKRVNSGMRQIPGFVVNEEHRVV